MEKRFTPSSLRRDFRHAVYFALILLVALLGAAGSAERYPGYATRKLTPQAPRPIIRRELAVLDESR